MRTNLLPLAKEGWRLISVTLVLVIIFMILDLEFLAGVSFIVFLYSLFLFRNPERELANFETNSFLAPSDGVVKSIEEIDVDGFAYKLEIEGSYSDVGLLRMPMNAKVISSKKFNGTRVSKESKLYADLNENISLNFQDDFENNFRVDFRVKNSVIPLKADLIVSQKLNQAARFGFMVQGVTTIYLPSNFRLNVQLGNRLKASESLMGYFS